MDTSGQDTIIPEKGLRQHYDVLKELGDCYTSVSRYAQARECYEKAATLEPDEPGPYVGLGVVALQENLLEEAENSFNVARRLDNNCAEAYCGLAMTYQQRGRYEQSFDLYLKCLDIDADNLSALLGLFQTSCQMGSFSKVIGYLETYLDMHPGDTAVMFCLATLYCRDGRHWPAKRLLQDLLVLAPDNKDAANLLEEVEHKLASSRASAVAGRR